MPCSPPLPSLPADRAQFRRISRQKTWACAYLARLVTGRIHIDDAVFIARQLVALQGTKDCSVGTVRSTEVQVQEVGR